MTYFANVKKDFNLSSKRFGNHDDEGEDMIKVKYVKEFIRLLLDDCCGVDCIRIKELAGAEITKPSEDGE